MFLPTGKDNRKCLQTAREISISSLVHCTMYNLVAEDQADPVIVLFVGNIERPTERNQIKTPSFLST